MPEGAAAYTQLLSKVTGRQQVHHDIARINKTNFLFMAAAPRRACILQRSPHGNGRTTASYFQENLKLPPLSPAKHPRGRHALLQVFSCTCRPHSACALYLIGC